MKTAKYVILGGGMVAGYAAKEFVEKGGGSGDLTILSADTALPYERPPLSKGVLAGKDSDDSVFISPSEFYREHGIEVRLNTMVSGVDFAGKRLKLGAGEEVSYGKLVLSTGAEPRTLDVPGATLDGVLYLRSLDDAKRIKAHAVKGKRALVIGGGFIAMEAASSLAQRGLEVTMAVREERIWKAFFTEEMSAAFRRYYESRGIRFVFEAKITRLTGNGGVKAAELEDGQRIDCEVVVAGIGVTPVTDVFKGVTVDNGVRVNEFLETSASDVYAAGDVAHYRDVLFGKDRRVEHWDNAVSQGQHVARALLGERKPFVHVPYFFSDVFDLSYEFWGDTTGAVKTLYRGDLNSSSFSAWWVDGSETLLAAFVMGRPDEERESAPKLIESKGKFEG